MSARGGMVSAQGTNGEVTLGGNRNVEWVGVRSMVGSQRLRGKPTQPVS